MQTTRTAPASSRSTPRSRSAPPNARSSASIWSSVATAVVGSLTAGESARIAMSTSRRSAYGALLSIVRSRLSRIAVSAQDRRHRRAPAKGVAGQVAHHPGRAPQAVYRSAAS
jgi:hypothetical protein